MAAPQQQALTKTETTLTKDTRWQDQLTVVRQMMAPKASENEFAMFVYQANKTGLDPLAGQICLVSRWDSEEGQNKATIQIRIDGFRLIAERSGKYRGQTPVQWCGKDGVWKDIWTASENPFAARVGVYRSDCSEPIYAVARFSAYAAYKKGGDLNVFWKNKGTEMIAKCAEALALRKAFPQELSGLYSHEEMNTGEVYQAPKQSPIPKRQATVEPPVSSAPAAPAAAKPVAPPAAAAPVVDAEEVEEPVKPTPRPAKSAPEKPVDKVNTAALLTFHTNIESAPDVKELDRLYEEFREAHRNSPQTLLQAYELKGQRLRRFKETAQ